MSSAAHGSGSHTGRMGSTEGHYGRQQQLVFTDAWMTVDPRILTTEAPDEKGKLQNALDNFCATGELFLGRFVILSAAHRRFGGQGIVQARCCIVFAVSTFGEPEDSLTG